MAKQTHDREDLLRDAKAMTLRGQTEFGSETVVIGFRPEGQASVFWGADPVIQLTADGLLRRLYLDGQKYAAENGTLIHLVQDPDANSRLSFKRNRLSAQACQERLDQVAAVLSSSAKLALDPQRQWQSNDHGFHAKLRDWASQVRAITNPVGIAASASV